MCRSLQKSRGLSRPGANVPQLRGAQSLRSSMPAASIPQAVSGCSPFSARPSASTTPIRLAAVGRSLEVLLVLGKVPTQALVDTGASRSFVRDSLLPGIGVDVRHRACAMSVVVADGRRVRVSSEALLPFSLGSITSRFPFLVLATLTSPVILGIDFMVRFGLSPVPREGIMGLADGSTVPFLPTALSPEATTQAAASHTIPLAGPRRLGEARTPRERQALLGILDSKYFASKSQPLGRATCAVHHIDTGQAHPVAQRLRPTSPREREVIRHQIQEMMTYGAIRPSQSPWASPVVLVGKKDGETRFCVDYRKLNAVTVKDAHPLPRIADMLESLRGSHYFTTLDAAKGYWHIPMAPDSIEKTAFSCSEGLFEFTVMPFGLCNAPATYQRTMQQVLAGLIGHGCLVYIDDILIYSRTFEEHLRMLATVLERCHSAGILLKAEKCLFARDETEYLGHLISSAGVQQDPRKLEKLRQYPTPTDQRAVRAFLGFASYYRKFVKDFALLATPLYALTKEPSAFE